MQNASTITSLLDQARRRYAARVTLRQFALAAAGAAAAFVLLLLLGTQVLDWWWPAAVFTGALAFGLWRTRGRIPTAYAAAQTIDRELHLEDALSTAYAFRDADLGAREPLRLAQQADAARAAAGVNLAAVIPFRVPREAWWAAGCAVLALTLFGIRYGVLGTLDLKASLVDVAFDTFFTPDSRQIARNPGPRPPWSPPGFEDADPQESSRDAAEDRPLNADPQNDPDIREPEANADPQSRASGKSDQQEGQQEGAEQQGKEGKPGETGGKEGQEQKGEHGRQGKPEQKPGDGKPSQQAAESQSLMDKMRDALNNLVNKMKSEPKEGKQTAQNQKQGQEKQGDKGQQQAKAQSGQSQQDADARNEQGQQGEQSSQQARANERSSDQAPAPDSKGGVGQQDGAKDSQLAEQLEAMGKISEILGKRQQTLSGEVMVEVQNSRQSLKTAYSNKSGRHAEAGGEVHRDEVPLVFQQYVQQYFEEVRKAPKLSKAPARGGAN